MRIAATLSYSPLLALVLLGCPKDKDVEEPDIPVSAPTVEFPDSWNSRETAIAMRLTNASPSQSAVTRALNTVLNERIDLEALMMRGGAPVTAEGDYMNVDVNKPIADRIAGTAAEQINAWFTSDASNEPIEREAALDDCGNEMIAAFISPDMLKYALPGEAVIERDEWTLACADDPDCNDTQVGSINASFGELRFDGLLDMQVQINPRIKPARTPAFWGHWYAYYLTDNNPGAQAVSAMFNVGKAQISALGLWEIDRSYVDEYGLRELYKFPHQAREITKQDLIVALEGSPGCEKYYDAQGYDSETMPFGCAAGTAMLLDRDSDEGATAYRRYSAGGQDATFTSQLTDSVTHQIGAALACPAVGEAQYIKEGPLELFLCPDGDLSSCIGFHDMEQGACDWQTEAGNPLGAPVTFREVFVESPTIASFVEATRYPYEVSVSPAAQVPVTSARLQFAVTAQTIVYVQDVSRITRLDNVNTPGNPQVVTLPSLSANSHCETEDVKRMDIGEALPSGNYAFTVDFTNQQPFWIMVTQQGIFEQ